MCRVRCQILLYCTCTISRFVGDLQCVWISGEEPRYIESELIWRYETVGKRICVGFVFSCPSWHGVFYVVLVQVSHSLCLLQSERRHSTSVEGPEVWPRTQSMHLMRFKLMRFNHWWYRGDLLCATFVRNLPTGGWSASGWIIHILRFLFISVCRLCQITFSASRLVVGQRVEHVTIESLLQTF